MAVSEFQFVNQHAPGRHKDRDPITKHLIRKKAARAAAITKKQETISSQSRLAKNGQHEVIPAFLIHPSADATAFLPSPAIRHAILSRLQPQLQHPYVRLSKILRLCMPEFTALIHDNAGRVPYLDDAIASLRARIRESVGAASTSTDGAAMHLYGRAVSSLQTALQNPVAYHTETWLAAICLTLFELLDLADDNPTWVLHAKGAFCVLVNIGPENLVSESHKVMLTASAAAITTETLHGGARCMLGEPAWQAALERCLISTASNFHSRGRIVITLQLLRCRLPSLFVDVTDVVVHERSSSLAEVSHDLDTVCTELQACLAEWARELYTPLEAAQAEADRMCTLEMGLSCAAVALRLLSALRPYEVELETAASQFASQALEQPPPAFANERTYHRGVAKSVVNTTRAWRDGQRVSSSNGQKFIESGAFRTWSAALGRPVR